MSIHKGNDPLCCCTGCQMRPTITPDASVHNKPPVTFLNMWQAFCCSCIPMYCCVKVTDHNGNTGEDVFRMFCATSPLLDQQPLYIINGGTGGVIVGGLSIDLKFYFFIQNGVCKFAVRSDILGINENSTGASKVIDAAARANGFCSNFNYDGTGQTIFNVESGTAAGTSTSTSGGRLSIVVKPVDHIPITGRPGCLDSHGIYHEDTAPIKDSCCNCPCICDCMCLSVGTTGPGGGQWKVCLTQETGTASATSSSSAKPKGPAAVWYFPNGMIISLSSKDGIGFKDLISCWDLDEASGTRFDSYGKYNLAATAQTGTGGPGSGPGLINKAAVFDGHDRLCVHADELSFSGFSCQIALWVSMSTLSADQVLVGKWGDTLAEQSWKIWFDSTNNKFAFTVTDGVSYTTIRAGTPVLGTWTLVVAMVDIDAGSISLYVNKSSVFASSLFTGPIQYTTDIRMCFGAQDATDPQYYTGSIDQSLIAVRLGTPTTMVDYLYNNGKGLACKADNRCYLSLDNVGHFIAPLPDPVLVGDDAGVNPCPRPKARWELMAAADADIPFPHPVEIVVGCNDCGAQCKSTVPSCCPATGRTQYPTQLIAQVTTNCGLCPDFTVTLIRDPILDVWIGYAMMCGHQLKMTIGCPFNTLDFDGSPCVPVVVFDHYASCDPVLAHFDFFVGGIDCCGIESGTSTKTPHIQITIHE